MPDESEQGRIQLRYRIPMPPLPYESRDGQQRTLGQADKPATLLVLWASWCPSCFRELTDLHEQEQQLRDHGVQTVALSIDKLARDESASQKNAVDMVNRLQLGFASGFATEELIGKLEAVFYYLYDYQRPWSVPSSFLIDPQGQLGVIYVGHIDVEQLLQDVEQLSLPDREWLTSSLPFPGRWSGKEPNPDLGTLIATYFDRGFHKDAEAFAARYQHILVADSTFPGLLTRMAKVHHDQADLPGAIDLMSQAVALDPRNGAMQLQLSRLYFQVQDWEKAIEHGRSGLEVDPGSTDASYQTALALQQSGKLNEAIAYYENALRHGKDRGEIHYSLSTALMSVGQSQRAGKHLREAYKLQPDSLVALNGYAWFLATTDGQTKQDLILALRIAQKAAKKTNYSHPQVLDTLAASFAANAQFDEAVETSQKAIELATASGSQELAEEIGRRASLYRKRQPFREPVRK
jgi:tetratricopeptide (TPR) repeat protein